jgi:hypothetical protein
VTRQAVAAALARRIASQPAGRLREALLARLAAHTARPATAAWAPSPPAAPSPLAELIARLGTASRPPAASRHEPTWRALRLQRRLQEVQALPPEHLGPLNSQVLASRALQALAALSPGYLQHLLVQMDALAGLNALKPAPVEAPTAPKPRPRTAAKRR